MNDILNEFWIFHGIGGRFTSGVFSTIEKAEKWIYEYKLTGLLTSYPVDISVYDWAIQNKSFEVKHDKDKSSEFIQKFTSALQEHHHYENGVKES